MTIFHSGGVPSVGPYTQPAIAATADCVRFISDDCSTPFDANSDNSLKKELLNLTDAAGIAYDCSSLTNITDAIQALICQAFDDRVFAGDAHGDPSTFTLPAGGTWRGVVSAYGNSGPNTLTPNTITAANENNQSAGANWGGQVAGGTSFGATALGGATMSLSYFFVRVDCP